MAANSKRKFITPKKALEALFHNDYRDTDSNSSYNDIYESDKDIFIYCDYNENQNNKHVNYMYMRVFIMFCSMEI